MNSNRQPRPARGIRATAQHRHRGRGQPFGCPRQLDAELDRHRTARLPLGRGAVTGRPGLQLPIAMGVAGNFLARYDSKAVARGGDLRRAFTTMRWRLAIGLASLVATIVLTFPPGAVRQAAEIWPNALGQVADVI